MVSGIWSCNPVLANEIERERVSTLTEGKYSAWSCGSNFVTRWRLKRSTKMVAQMSRWTSLGLLTSQISALECNSMFLLFQAPLFWFFSYLQLNAPNLTELTLLMLR